MADNTVSNKFTGDSSSAQKAIAELEKKVEDLNKAFTEGKSKAKSAAIAAKESAKAAEDASKQAARAAKADAAESRKVLRNWVAYNKQADADASSSRRVYYAEIRRLEQQELAASKRAAIERKKQARELAKAQKEASDEQARAGLDVQSWLTGLVGVQSIYTGITAGIKDALDFQRQLVRESDEQGRKADRRTRSFAVNAGLNAEESKAAKASMDAVAIATGVSQDRLEPAASELAGSNFAAKDASGAALKNIVHATGVTGGGDIAETASAIGLTLNAQGMDKTAENVQKVGQVAYALRKEGRTEMNSFKFLAPELSIAADQPFEQNASLMGAFEDVGDSAKAAGAFGSFHRRLRAPVKETLDSLAMAGIKPQEVDFVGEDTPKVIKRLSEAFKKVPEEKRGEFIKGLAGSDYLGQTDFLLKHPEAFTDKLEATKNAAGYDDAIKQKFSGMGFSADVTKIEQENRLADIATTGTDLADQRDLARTARGVSMYRSEKIKNAGQMFAGTGLETKAESATQFLTNPGNLLRIFGAVQQFSGGGAQPTMAPLFEGLRKADNARFAGINEEAQQIVTSRITEGGNDKQAADIAELKELTKQQVELAREANNLARNRGGNPSGAAVKRPVAVNASE